MSALMTDRILPFEGIHNFRDYGGYRADGGTLRRGQFWRSAHHKVATDPDLSGVTDLGLSAIIDLRGDGERAAHPCRRAPGFSVPVLWNEGETAGLAPHIEAAGGGLSSSEDVHRRMLETYADMPFRPALLGAMRLYFRALADSEAGTLVHCVAGKDRTGLAVALFHTLMGVHDDDILEDYLLTNSAGRVDARIAEGAQMLRAAYGAKMTDDAIRALMSVHPSYLERAFTEIMARHGSLEAYARDMLGVDEAMVERIRARALS